MKSPSRVTLLMAVAMSVASCSLTNPSIADCSSEGQPDAYCAAQFGERFVCASGGFCEESDKPLSQCEVSLDCASRGFGYVCESNQCVDAEPIERCTKTFPENLFENLDQHRDYIVFGSIHDRSSGVHQQRENGLETGAFVINDADGFTDPDGVRRRFGIIFCDAQNGEGSDYSDDLARPAASDLMAEWLFDEMGVNVLLGPPSSGDTQRIHSELVTPRKPRIVHISPSSSSPLLTALDPPNATDEQPGFFWRTADSGATQVPALVFDMKRRGVQNLAIIRESGAFGEGVAAEMNAQWSSQGGVVSEECVYGDAQDTGIAECVTRIGTSISSYDAVFFVGQTRDHATFLELIASNGDYTRDTDSSDDVPDTLVYFPHTGSGDSVFGDLMPSDYFSGIFASVQWVDTTQFTWKTFAQVYESRFASPPTAPLVPEGYDAVWMAAFGTVWAYFNEPEVNGLGIARGLRKTFTGTNEVTFTTSGWQSGVNSFKNGTAFDSTGASGALAYDPATEEKRGGVALRRGTRDGAYEEIDVFPNGQPN